MWTHCLIGCSVLCYKYTSTGCTSYTCMVHTYTSMTGYPTTTTHKTETRKFQEWGWMWVPSKHRLLTRSHSSYHSKQNVSQSCVFGKLSSLSIITHSTGIPPCHQLPNDGTFYFKVQFLGGKEELCISKIVYRNLITPSIGVGHPGDAYIICVLLPSRGWTIHSCHY